MAVDTGQRPDKGLLCRLDRLAVALGVALADLQPWLAQFIPLWVSLPVLVALLARPSGGSFEEAGAANLADRGHLPTTTEWPRPLFSSDA